MSAKINSRMIKPGPDVFYTKAFKDVLEAHMGFLRNHQNTRNLPINDHDKVVYNGDLGGYLNSVKTPLHLHWVIMRMNNMYSMYDFGPHIQTLLIPEESTVDKIRQQFVSKSNSIGS